MNAELEEIRAKIKELREREKEILEKIKKEKESERWLKKFDKFVDDVWDNLGGELNEYCSDIINDFDEDLKEIFKLDVWDNDDIMGKVDEYIKNINHEISILAKLKRNFEDIEKKITKEGFKTRKGGYKNGWD